MKKHLQVILLILFGSLTWAITMFRSGLKYSYGVGYWGANGHDGIWHLALIESLKKVNLSMPIFAGGIIRNYHIGFDVLIAFLGKITMLSSSLLYFQIIPIVFALLIGFLTYKFIFLWTKSKIKSLLSVFFVYFGGSFGWLVEIVKSGRLDGESMFWSQQAISTLINPPFAMSLIFILLGLISLHNYIKKGKIKYFIISFICFGFLIQIKSYSSVLSLGGLFIAGLYEFIKNKNKKIIKVLLTSVTLSLIIFLFLKGNVGNIFVFRSFWFLETMMGLTDRVGWMKFYSAMINYRAGGIYIKAVIFYLIAFGIFILGNLGTRIISFFEIIKKIKNPKKMDWVFIFLASIFFAGIIIPQFILQSGTSWNTIQFFYYSLFSASVLSGIWLDDLLEEKQRFSKLILVITILLTIPTTLGSLYFIYLPINPPAFLSRSETEALNFLSKQPEGIVLTYPFDRVKAGEADKSIPRPLYLYESSAYVSAYSKKQVFLEDEVNLDITGFNWKIRKEEILNFYQSNDHEFVRQFLEKNNISYIYWLKGQRAALGESQLGISQIFENEGVQIYKTN